MIVVTGASGQLGRALCATHPTGMIGLSSRDLDIRNSSAVAARFREIKPRVVINCAAYTAVDAAEDDPESCIGVNQTGVANLSRAADEMGALLVHISTDYVFGNSKPEDGPHREEDAVSPLGVYAKSKREGEIQAATCREHLIVRTCGLYGESPSGSNFVDKMIQLGRQRDELRIVDDQTCNPTSAVDLAGGILRLIEVNQRGVFHVVSQPALTWFAFAKQIFKSAGIDVSLVPITSEEFGAKAPRPRYSALDTSKYTAAASHTLPRIPVALASYLGSDRCGTSNG